MLLIRGAVPVEINLSSRVQCLSVATIKITQDTGRTTIMQLREYETKSTVTEDLSLSLYTNVS